MPGKYGMIRDAIEGRSCLLARHRGVWVSLAPYVLGWRDEHPHLVGYAVGSTPGWVCLRVAELSDLRLTDGPWDAPTAVPLADMEMDLVEAAAHGTPPESVTVSSL